MARSKWNNTVCYLYCITHKKSKKKYIGLTSDPTQRWSDHVILALDKGTKKKYPIHKAIQRGGVKNFTFGILCSGSRSIMSHVEVAMIAHWKTRVPKGYNVTPGGEM